MSNYSKTVHYHHHARIHFGLYKNLDFFPNASSNSSKWNLRILPHNVVEIGGGGIHFYICCAHIYMPMKILYSLDPDQRF